MSIIYQGLVAALFGPMFKTRCPSPHPRREPVHTSYWFPSRVPSQNLPGDRVTEVSNGNVTAALE